MAIVAAGLEQLSEPELVCLELAWDALLAGTIPVGAVVVDADGEIIASGRNAVYGRPDPRLLCGSRLAHAEINALLWLPVDQRFSDCRLVTLLEPRQLCVGALRMATVGALTFVGADPVNGTAWCWNRADTSATAPSASPARPQARPTGWPPAWRRGPRTGLAHRRATTGYPAAGVP